MRFVKIDFPPAVFLPSDHLNSFYEDVPPEEKIEPSGSFLPPVYLDKNFQDWCRHET